MRVLSNGTPSITLHLNYILDRLFYARSNSNFSTFHRDWRAQQASEIAIRDEKSKNARTNTVANAERSIDAFYEEYSKKKERNIRENKYVL